MEQDQNCGPKRRRWKADPAHRAEKNFWYPTPNLAKSRSVWHHENIKQQNLKKLKIWKFQRRKRQDFEKKL